MKRITLLLTIIILFNAHLCLGKNTGISKPQKELKLGETLRYSVELLGIPIGKIVLKIEDMVKLNHHECYHITAHTTINKFFSKFYDLEYKVDTYIDKKLMQPRRFTKMRRMKKVFTYLSIDFDPEKNKVTYRYSTPSGPVEITDFPSLRKEIVVNEVTTFTVPANTQDLFSVFYYFRLLGIEEDKEYLINVFYQRKNWPVNIKVGEVFKRELRKKGAFRVFSISNRSDLANYILGKREMTVYFTADSQRIPIEFILRTAVGPLRGIIQDLKAWKNLD